MESAHRTTPVTLHLVFDDAEPSHPDPIAVGQAAQTVTQHLRSDGYTVTPTPGTKGVGDVLIVLAQHLHDNQEMVVAALGAIQAIATCLDTWKKSRPKPESAPEQHDIEVVVGQTVVPLSDQRLLERLLTDAAGDSVQSMPPITVRIRVPGRRVDDL